MMEYRDAGELVAKGMMGKWIKIPAGPERDALIESMGHENWKRGGRGESALRHFENGDYIVMHDMGGSAETHPDDIPKVV